MLLKVGEKAPTFSLPDADMETIDLADYLGKKRIVLFFYPQRWHALLYQGSD
jgi:peroxiredoxin Q/BCP